MTEELIRAIYVSTATRDLRDEELVSLLDVCRRNNATRGITGVLAYHDRSFVQVLEGPTNSVEALLATIDRDGRHAGMSIFDQSKVDGRTFGEWAMGWVRTSHLAQEGFDPAVLFLRDTPVNMVNALLYASRRTAHVSQQRHGGFAGPV